MTESKADAIESLAKLNEVIDGEAGRMANDPGLPGGDFDWAAYVAKVEDEAKRAAG